MNTNQPVKYVAVTTCNYYNDFVSPYCSTPEEVQEYCETNKIYCDAIQPVGNHQECNNPLGYK